MQRLVHILLVSGLVLGLGGVLLFGHLDLWWFQRGPGGELEWNRRILYSLLTVAGSCLGLVGLSGRRVRLFLTSSRAVVAANVLLMVSVALVLMIFVNLISARNFFRYDMTRAQLDTIGARSQRVAEGLTEGLP